MTDSPAGADVKNSADQNLYSCEIDPNDDFSSQGILFHWCKNDAAVLDVGCACGYMGKALHHYKHCRCWGIEYEPRHRREAAALGVYEEIAATDLNAVTPESLAAWRGRFDCIVMGDVLEHLISAAPVLAAMKELLAPEGELLVSLPNISHASIKAGLLLDQFRYTPHGLLDQTHLHFFTAENTAKLMCDAGVEITEARGTMMGIAGFTDGAAFSRLEPAILRRIFADVHSYICQYVCRVVPSRQSPGALLTHNLRKLDFKFDDFPPELRQYAERTMRQFAVGRPSGSYRLTSRTFDEVVI